MYKQINHFILTGKLNTTAKDFYGNIQTFLSERYKDVIKRQIDGMLKSYISNRKNDFKAFVHNTKLPLNIKKELYSINKRDLWFNHTNLLARKIFKYILSKNSYPTTKNINLTLNTKVYGLEENRTTKSCDYHIKLKTCDENKFIYLSLKTNTYFKKIIDKLKENNKFFKLNNSIQLNFKHNKLSNIVLSLSTERQYALSYEPKTSVIGLDFGLTNLLTTNFGTQFSKNFINRLKYYDDKILKLSNELKKRNKHYKLSSNKRYSKLQHKLKSFIKNEMNRVVNRIVDVYKPDKIVLENLNFQNSNLSKKLNRLISNCGISALKNKMNILSLYNGITVEYVNPAYTSQECSVCGNVDEKNRKSQSKFECLCCGLKLNADVNASRNIINRANDVWFTSNKYANKLNIKQHLLSVFCQRNLSFSQFVDI
jgi:putative transposase